MKNSERRWLLDTLRDVLVPALEERGFVQYPLDCEDKASREIRSTFPLGRFRRIREKVVDQIEIQLDKHGRTAFRVNVGVVPLEGIDHLTGRHVPQEEMWTGYLSKKYHVYQFPAIGGWFRVWRWPWKAVAEADFKKLVDSVVGIIPEIEDVFRDGRCGSHVKRIG